MSQIFQGGDTVADRFEIVRLIAEGGMGQVFEARDRTLGGLVALKVLNYPNVEDPIVNRRFRREIQLARQVTHPNVCRIYDVYQHRVPRGLRPIDVTLVTMELLAGETLEDRLVRCGRMSEEEALPLIRQMAAALQAAHAAGVIHRDFKTSNVMLVPRESPREPGGLRAVVTDFGLARSFRTGPGSSTTPLTGEMKVVGTADYMAPEQLRGAEIGPASDLYALGVVIFEMVTGKRPYTAPNALVLLTRRATEPPSSPLDHYPALDPRWASVILRCMEEDPGKRPSSAGQVVRLLTGERQQTAALAVPPRRGSFALAAVAVLLAAGLAVLLAVRQEPREITFGQGVQLTTFPGLELDPAFSPDGAQIAYSSDESGAFEIYVLQLGPGGTARRLTEGGGQNFEPVFSPDGETIVFHSAKRGGLWETPVAGGTAWQLTEEGSRPAVSPDGSLLVFQSESAPLVSDNVLPALGTTTLWVLERDSGTRRQLTRAGQPAGGHGAPAWSPDGERIAFSATQRRSSKIWSVDREGKDLVRLVDDPNPAYDPVFSPGGRRLYFAGSTRQVHALWALPLGHGSRAKGPPVQIRNLGLASIRLAAFSNDGTKMAYTALFTRSNLWSLPVGPDGVPRGAARPLTSGTSRNTRPSFSPDGARLAWERWTRGGNRDVWVMGAEGGDAVQLTLAGANDALPTWLPDGRHIAFLRQVAEGFRLVKIDLTSRREEELADLASDADWARLSPDGRQVAFHSKAGDVTFHVQLLDLATGETRQVLRGGTLTGFPCWSPDGRWLVFQTRRGEHHQVMMTAGDGSGDGLLLSEQEAQHYPFSFSPDSRRIAFATNRGGRWNVWWVDHDTREERQLTDLELLGGYARYPAWSPRGDRIVYEQAESTGDVWIAEQTPR